MQLEADARAAVGTRAVVADAVDRAVVVERKRSAGVQRDRGFGVQLEYRLTPAFELFASGFCETDQYHLDEITPALDDVTFRDRQFLTGGGFEWKLSRRVRIKTEAGYVVDRKLRIRSDDFGTLASERASGSSYFEVRFEVRP